MIILFFIINNESIYSFLIWKFKHNNSLNWIRQYLFQYIILYNVNAILLLHLHHSSISISNFDSGTNNCWKGKLDRDSLNRYGLLKSILCPFIFPITNRIFINQFESNNCNNANHDIKKRDTHAKKKKNTTNFKSL